MIKGKIYYYVGSILVTCGVLLFISLFTAEAFFREGESLYPVIIMSLTALALCVSLFMTARAIRNGNQQQLEYYLIGILRFVTSSVMLGYSFTKLHNGHMYLSYSALDTKLDALNDFDTVWSFYGRYSSLQMLLGIFELVPACLLLFRRTTFLGALLMFPVVANIVLLNSYYHIGGFTLYVSGLVLIFIVFILYSFKIQIVDFLNKVSGSSPKSASMKPLARKTILTLRFAPLFLFSFIILIGTLRPHHKIAVKGAFELVELKENGRIKPINDLPLDIYRKIYFEKRKIQSTVINAFGLQGASIRFSGKDSIQISYRNGALDTYVEEDTNGRFVGSFEILKSELLVLRGKQKNLQLEASYKKLPLREFDYWWE